MKTTKRQLESIKFASKDETRVTLNSLYLRGNEAIATNGHYLSFVTAPKAIENNGADPLLLDGDQIHQVAKMIKVKKNDGLDLKSIEIDAETIKAPLHHFEMKTNLVDGQYPNIDRVRVDPADRPHFIGVDPHYLRDICDFIAKGQPSRYNSQMKIAISDQDHSMLITATDQDGHELEFVLMPSKL